MTVVKIKNPVEYSFQQWIRQFPKSSHPSDRRRFFQFVKNVCRFHAKKWKDTRFLENKILKTKPECSKEWLEETLILYESLIIFWKTPACQLFSIGEHFDDVPRSYILEKSFKNGEFHKKIIQYSKS